MFSSSSPFCGSSGAASASLSSRSSSGSPSPPPAPSDFSPPEASLPAAGAATPKREVPPPNKLPAGGAGVGPLPKRVGGAVPPVAGAPRPLPRPPAPKRDGPVVWGKRVEVAPPKRDGTAPAPFIPLKREGGCVPGCTGGALKREPLKSDVLAGLVSSFFFDSSFLVSSLAFSVDSSFFSSFSFSASFSSFSSPDTAAAAGEEGASPAGAGAGAEEGTAG
mmetsp:Transcript_28530/g.55878  ORF Transcript_28530/g.55878 Transcript_28530/m.55878 type:complete len:220 (-) Transcript_28530:473-1132(-)